MTKEERAAKNLELAKLLGWTNIEPKQWWVETYEETYLQRGHVGTPPGGSSERPLPDFHSLDAVAHALPNDIKICFDEDGDTWADYHQHECQLYGRHGENLAYAVGATRQDAAFEALYAWALAGKGEASWTPDQRNALTSIARRAAQDSIEAERLMYYAQVSGVSELRALAADFERTVRQMHRVANVALCRDEGEEVRG